MLDTQVNLKSPRRQLYEIHPPLSTTTITPQTPDLSEASQLWLHIHLLQFSLDILTRGNSSRQACVLVEGQGTRLKVALANKYATSLGVREGMPIGAAQILGDLTVLARDERAERQALERLCAWFYQFTPIVSPVPHDGLLLEIRGSLKLFGGVDGLLNRVRRGLRDLGYRAAIAIAPTPQAATVLARAGQLRTIFTKAELSKVLSSVPLSTLRLESKQRSILESFGVRTIGDCLRLPHGGFGRRTSPKVVDVFARLIGRAPDPRTRFELPKLFQSSLDLPWETINAQSLSIAGEKLLHELTGYLRSCVSATRHLRWTLTYADGHATHFQLELTQPSREHQHFALLLREQLSRFQLDGHVKGIALYVDDITPLQDIHEGDLFKQRREGAYEDWSSFLDRLRARLGEKAVRGLQRVADHRPECAWRWSQVSSYNNKTTSGQFGTTPKVPERPVWLMRRPIRLRPQQGHLDINGPLQLTEDRERIETGWWDGKPIGRDYFVAANPSGARLWIYRELTGEKNWYLHGIFE